MFFLYVQIIDRVSEVELNFNAQTLVYFQYTVPGRILVLKRLDVTPWWINFIGNLFICSVQKE